MRHLYLLLLISFSFFNSNAQTVQDDFEGSGTITSWSGDDCGMNNNFPNPYKQGINTSNTVLKYDDIGGTYANVRFDVPTNFNISDKNVFVLKIYVPSSGLTGSQQNQVSLKLQNNTLALPWTTQTEIKKTILLNQWQEITFDFINDGYININGSSGAPKNRTDLNRVVIQINGEDNTDKVVAYIDDLNTYNYTAPPTTTTFNNLVWADEFDVAGPIDGTKWFHQTQLPNGGSWYNGEVQHYTNRIQNSFVSNEGFLNVVAIKENFMDQGVTKNYTSARLNSKFAFTYGRVEVRAKLPSGTGTWPAIWTLGKNINEDGAYWDLQGYGTTPWPACGEIDIMEHWGTNQNFVQSAMHTPSSYGGTVNHGGQTIPTASSAFHVYAMEWTADKIVFSVDDVVHYTYNPSTKDASTWPFNLDQYILLNFAVQPNIVSSFIQDAMVIDYVRVYQSTALSTNNPTIDSEVKIYPNPVKDTLNINLGNIFSKEVHVRIYDISGRVMFKEYFKHNSKNLEINTSFLNKGVYFISLNLNGTDTRTQKFVKY
jgi:beta-glucanase (GH16 family)